MQPPKEPIHSEKEMNRFNRLRTLRTVGAPRWIIKHEQVKLVEARRGGHRFDLLEKYVRPILGQGSITVPETSEDLEHDA
jgi:hypothetical protein